MAGLIIAAVGMTFVLITGGIDISIGSVIGVVCMMLAWMMEVKHMSAVVAIILVLAFGVIFGLVQGFLVAYLKIQPFIVTLGGMFFARGLTALISSDMISIENPTFLSLANYRIYFGFNPINNADCSFPPTANKARQNFVYRRITKEIATTNNAMTTLR